MTIPSPSQPDLSKLRIDRDGPSPPVRRAVKRNAIFAGIVALVAVGSAVVLQRGSAAPVQTVLVAASTDPGAGGAGSRGASVTANGYVVARTRASVSS
ncbi:MAG: hypothetical protein M3303_11560, partial [Gemmatimonadota bacterium]|nr:hypothetical protein [Gemmatimonadota bacterium]